VASTYLSFGASGEDLLVNLSGEQVYLYNTTNYQQQVAYEFDKTDDNCTPELKPTTRTYNISNGRSNGEMGMRPMFVPVPHSIPLVNMEESDVKGAVVHLKNRGKQLYKEEKLDEALRALNSGIAQCPNWHMLYFLRGTALYSRKW
jgi:hypothetical protein